MLLAMFWFASIPWVPLLTTINCYCIMGRVDFGFSLLGSCFKRGLVPSSATYGTLLKGLFKENRISQAQELFKKIIYEKLCETNGVMFGTVIDGLCKTGNTSTAIKFLRAMGNGQDADVQPDTLMYTTIIDSLCKIKRWTMLLPFYKR